MPNIRLPLASFLEARDSAASKDAEIKNGYIEQESQTVFYVIKRPGLTLESTRTGTAQGIFVYGTKVYIWDSNVTPTTPDSINISSLV